MCTHTRVPTGHCTIIQFLCVLGNVWAWTIDVSKCTSIPMCFMLNQGKTIGKWNLRIQANLTCFCTLINQVLKNTWLLQFDSTQRNGLQIYTTWHTRPVVQCKYTYTTYNKCLHDVYTNNNIIKIDKTPAFKSTMGGTIQPWTLWIFTRKGVMNFFPNTTGQINLIWFLKEVLQQVVRGYFFLRRTYGLNRTRHPFLLFGNFVCCCCNFFFLSAKTKGPRRLKAHPSWSLVQQPQSGEVSVGDSVGRWTVVGTTRGLWLHWLLKQGSLFHQSGWMGGINRWSCVFPVFSIL